MINAGELNQRITIQNYTTPVIDGHGGRSRTYANYKTVWAKVKYTGGVENDEDGYMNAVKTADILIRYDAATLVTEDMRVVHDGDNWDIIGIQEYGFNEGQLLSVRRYAEN